MNELEQMSSRLSFKLDGNTYIDAELLTKSLSNITKAYKSCMLAQYGDDVNIEIDVCAFQEGSFDVLLQTIVSAAPLVLPQIPQAVKTTKDFVEIIKLKHDLKGQKPKSVELKGEKVKIENALGDTSYYDCTVYNVYINNPSIDGALSSAFETLVDKPRPAISFKAEGTTPAMVTIPEGSYPEMKIPVVDELSSPDLQVVERYVTEDLLLKSADFLGDSKWAFKYDGKAIYASIEDDDFKQRVRGGKVKLYAGIRIPVKMKIEVFLNEKLEIERHSYTIVEVLGEIIEPNASDDGQQSLFE